MPNIEIFNEEPSKVKHTIKKLDKNKHGDEIVEIEMEDLTPMPVIYIPKEAFANRRNFYNLPNATDDEIRGLIIEEHRLRIYGE